MDDSFSSVVTATNNNLTRLSRTMATTATALTSSYGELSSPTYQETMQELSAPLFRKRGRGARTRPSPGELVRGTNWYGEGRGGASDIPDDMLLALPPAKPRYSLYQGFAATFGGSEDAAAPFEVCAIRKELATSEICELDARIAELKQMRERVFEQVAEVEKEERRLERDPQDALQAEPTVRTPSLPRAGRRVRSSRRSESVLQRFYAAGDTICKLATGTDPVTALDFDFPYGTLVAATGSSVQVWDLGSSERACTLSGHTAVVGCLQMEANAILTGSNDATVRLWDLGSCSTKHTYEGHLDEVTAIHFDGKNMVSGSQDRTIRQWDLESGRCVQTLDVLWARPQEGWSPAPSVGALQNFDAALASGTSDGNVRLWDVRTGKVHRTLTGHMGAISSLQFDDIHLVSGSLDRTIRVWDLRTGSVIDVLSYDHGVLGLHFDHTRIVCATGQPTVQVYNRETESRWSCGAGETNTKAAPVTTVKYQNGYLVGGQTSGEVGVWAC